MTRNSDVRELIEFVNKARAALEANRDKLGSIYDSFPRGSCGPVSEVLGQLVKERFGVEAIYVCKQAHPDLRPDQSHAWLEMDGLIVDITHDQFGATGLSGWIFERSAWHQAFTEELERRGCCEPEGWPLYPWQIYAVLKSLR